MRPSIYHLGSRIRQHVTCCSQCASRIPTRASLSLALLRPTPSLALPSRAMPSPSAPARPSSSKARAVARPSSAVLLVSPRNEILLLHRVESSSSFAAAHVFPGGNLDAFHDGEVPGPDAPGRHTDGPAYRLGAVRECFEETGILLARRRGGARGLVEVPQEERDAARKRVHGNEVRFADWLASMDAEADTDGLVPFTRWMTPADMPKRFTTQMYLYLLPISGASSSHASSMLVPTPDGGLEHTAAEFASPRSFLARAAAGEIALWPPQFYLVHHLAAFLEEQAGLPGSIEEESVRLAAQRRKLLSFVRRVPTAETREGAAHRTARIGWGDKAMGPYQLARVGGRSALALDRPGHELEGTERGGDWERVVMVRWGEGGPSGMEVKLREDVLREAREEKGDEAKL